MKRGNPYGGEISLVVDGQEHVLKLTLGALVELEESIRPESLVGMIERFEDGNFGPKDVARLLLSGLRGGGWTGDAGDLLDKDIEGGLTEATRTAALLVARAFAMPT